MDYCYLLDLLDLLFNARTVPFFILYAATA